MQRGRLGPGPERVRRALEARGFSHRIVELEKTARSAAEAAEALGCEVGQIVKSLVFRGARTGRPVLVVASGANRVDEGRVAELLGEPVEKADAAFVKERTGFSIGGVPPLGHREEPAALVDEDLMLYERVWAAAGHPYAVFGLHPRALVEMTGGKVARVKGG